MNKAHKFKQTEIGLIPEDWDVKELGDIGDLKNGINYNRNDVGSGLRVVSVKQLFRGEYVSFKDLNSVKKNRISNYESYLLQKGDLLFARGSLKREGAGKLALVRDIPFDNVVFSGFIIRFRNTSRNDYIFLNYLLRSPIYRELFPRIAVGTTITNLNQEILKKVPIIIPPLPEQSAIAKILSDLDSKIELLQKQNETLEKIGQAIFKHWFVDFEFPNEEGKPYKSSDGKMVESELGEIPEGWSVGKLGEKIKTVLGGTPSKSKPEYWEGNIPWINSGAINDFPVMNFSETISELGLKNSAAKLMPKGTVVLPFVISVGKEVRISVLGIESSGNQSVLGILENEEYSSEFIYNWIQLRKGHLYLSATGGAQQHINKGNVDSMELLIPEKKILTNFNMATKNVFNKIYLNSEAILSLQKTRDLLLPKLMTGKIRVPLEVEG